MSGDLLSLLLRRSMRSLLYLSPLSLLSKFVSDLGAFAFVCIVPSPVFLENEPMIEFDRNQNPLRDELLIDHKWTMSDDGTLEVPMKRLVDILTTDWLQARNSIYVLHLHTLCFAFYEK